MNFPRVTLPGVDPDEVAALEAALEEARAEERHRAGQQAAMVLTMIRSGYSPAGRTRPDKKSRASRKARKAHRRTRP